MGISRTNNCSVGDLTRFSRNGPIALRQASCRFTPAIYLPYLSQRWVAGLAENAALLVTGEEINWRGRKKFPT